LIYPRTFFVFQKIAATEQKAYEIIKSIRKNN
jgi:hypothetical protein